MIKCQVVLFFCLFALAHTELKCYDCDPKSEGKCVNPERANVKTTACHDLPKSRTSMNKSNGITDSVHECFSLYFESGGSWQSGVYRGCLEKHSNVLSSCEYLKQQITGGKVTTCKSCTYQECNIDYVGGQDP